MQAVSGKPVLRIDRRKLCLVGVRILSKYPVARESQKFPPKKSPWVAFVLEHREMARYVYLCAVRLAARNSYDPGYATIVRFTDGIGPLKAAYGIFIIFEGRDV